jgi:hypothetical protein
VIAHESKMRRWGHTATSEELNAAVVAAGDAFRSFWKSIGNPPYRAEFDGGPDDIRALDFLIYEGIGYGPCKDEQAALVCGEVLRRAAGFEWVVSNHGEWVVSTREGTFPSFAFCPVARLRECWYGAGPQFDKHAWVVEQGALACLLFVDPEFESGVRDLIGDHGEYTDLIRRTIRSL